MQKIRPLILVAAMLAAGSATAATVSISIDGTTNSYTLGSLSVDGAGNATVSASGDGQLSAYTVTISPSTGGSINGTSGVIAAGTPGSWTAAADTANGYSFGSWGGACAGTTGTTCAKTVNSNLTVSATFTAANSNDVVVDGNCPEVDPTKVTVVDTAVSSGYYPRTDFASVAPERIFAYKFTTKNLASLGNWVATQLTAAPTGKMVKITQCAGVLETTNTVGACERFTAESTRIDYTVNKPELGTRSYCQLQPSTVYYANVISKSKLTDAAYNCGTTASVATTKCGFSMTGE